MLLSNHREIYSEEANRIMIMTNETRDLINEIISLSKDTENYKDNENYRKYGKMSQSGI